MAERWIAIGLTAAVVVLSSGCEITASMYVQQEYRADPHLDKPDGLAKAEIKVTRLMGRDGRR